MRDFFVTNIRYIAIGSTERRRDDTLALASEQWPIEHTPYGTYVVCVKSFCAELQNFTNNYFINMFVYFQHKFKSDKRLILPDTCFNTCKNLFEYYLYACHICYMHVIFALGFTHTYGRGIGLTRCRIKSIRRRCGCLGVRKFSGAFDLTR